MKSALDRLIQVFQEPHDPIVIPLQPLPPYDAQTIISIMNTAWVTTPEELQREQGYALRALFFLNDVRMDKAFWKTRKDPFWEHNYLGYASNAVRIHIHRVQQAQGLDTWKNQTQFHLNKEERSLIGT